MVPPQPVSALDDVALVLLIAIIGLVVYGVVGVYGITYEFAKARNHPHQDAIGGAISISLFTLGALRPFLWIWAMLDRPARGSGFSNSSPTAQWGDPLAQLEGRGAALITGGSSSSSRRW